MEGGNMAKEVQISDMNLLRQNSELIGKEKSKISTYKDQLNNALAKATNYEEINISEKARAIAELAITLDPKNKETPKRMKEALKALFECEVDLVRFRDSLRPLFKANLQRDVIYV